MKQRQVPTIQPAVEARVLDYHSSPETVTAGALFYQPPLISRRAVEVELSYDLLSAAMQGVL